jgi:hypothetical protein
MNIPLTDHAEDAAFAEQERRRDQERRNRQRKPHLNRLLGSLRSIAKDHLGLKDSGSEAQKTKSRLLRRIANHEAALVRDRRYQLSIDPWRREAGKPSERWARHLVRLKNNRQKIGLKRGTQRLNWKEANKRAIENAAAVKTEELNPVERRAVELLRGGKRKPIKNKIEVDAIRLAESVEQDWFSNQRKPTVKERKVWEAFKRVKANQGAAGVYTQSIEKSIADFEADLGDLNLSSPLSITDVISIAAPIIEAFAKKPIAFRKRGSDTILPSFEALYSIVCAYARDGEGCKKSTVNRLLKQVRKHTHAHGPQNDDIQVYIAPELRGWLE